MPIISQFYGIIIYMYREIGAKHKEPHIHIKYNEYELTMELNGKVINGKLPKKQHKLVEAWVILHNEELKAAWYIYQNDGEIIKIKGLE